MLAFTVVLVILAGGATALALVLGLRRFVDRGSLPEATPDVEGAYVTLLGGLYAILLAFVIIVVWGDFSDAAGMVHREATALVAVHRLAGALPEPQRGRLRALTREYAETMLREEWPAMARGRLSRRGAEGVDRMWEFFTGPDGRFLSGGVARGKLLDAFLQFTEHRRQRLFAAEERVPGILWAVLAVGAVLTVGIAALFRSEPLGTHVLKTATVAAMIALVLFTIRSLDRPFEGPAHVGPDAFRESLATLRAD